MKKLKDFYGNPSLIEDAWCFQSLFSMAALEAVTVCEQASGRTSNVVEAEYFIDYMNVFLIKKPLDFLYVMKVFEKQNSKVILMQKFNKCLLAKQNISIALLDDVETIKKIGEHKEWIDLPLQFRAKKLIYAENGKNIDIFDLLPKDIEISQLISEYILSWAFEEDRLNPNAVAYFEEKHPKKFKMLTNIKNR